MLFLRVNEFDNLAPRQLTIFYNQDILRHHPFLGEQQLMSPAPKKFVVEAEINLFQSAKYHVFAHSTYAAEEKLQDNLKKRLEKGEGAEIRTDDVNMLDYWQPKLSNIGKISCITDEIQ